MAQNGEGFEREEIVEDGLGPDEDRSHHDDLSTASDSRRGKGKEASSFDKHFSAGRPPKASKEQLMKSEGIIPVQSGTNKYASQKGLTGFGSPRDVLGHIVDNTIKPMTEEQVLHTHEIIRPQSGSNKYETQRGMTAIGASRDVNYVTKGTANVEEVPEEKARLTDGIIPLQSGTNRLASQQGMTAYGMPRSVLGRYNPDQDAESQGFIHLQMGTNKFASQRGMTDFGMPRHNVTRVSDEQRAEIPFDEGTVSKQTVGSSLSGNNQCGMTGFGMSRNTTIPTLRSQDRKAQGMLPFQMGINWGDSQAGKTAFGMPRGTFIQMTDDTREDLSEGLVLDPNLPKWSSGFVGGSNQAGMTAMGMPRDVKGRHLNRLW